MYGKKLFEIGEELAGTDEFQCQDYCIYYNENDMTYNPFYRFHHIEGFVVSVEKVLDLNNDSPEPDYTVYFHQDSKECTPKEFYELMCRTGEIK